MTMRTLLATLAVCALTSIAAAEPEVYATLAPAPGAPLVKVTIIGAPQVPATHLTLRDGATGARVNATEVIPNRAGTDAMTIAFVFAGGEVVIGNDDLEPADSPARYPGLLKGLKKGIDDARLDTVFPAGSQAVAIAYSEGSRVIQKLGPLDKFSGFGLGIQLDYYKRFGADLVSGIETGLSQLRTATTPRRALVVIGDGNDTNNETAVAALRELRKVAAQDNVETFAIVYKGALSDSTTVVDRFTARVRHVASSEALPEAIVAIATDLNNRYYATFPSTHIAQDGLTHELIVTVDKQDLEPVALVMPEAPSVSSLPSNGWWFQLAVGFALVALIAFGTWLTGRRTLRV